MAIRNIRKFNDDILRKKCRNVDQITERISTLVQDMIDTMYSEKGVGLAAPQVGVLKRIFVIDVLDGMGPRVFINPRILDVSGEQTDVEGCLSLPGEQKEVTRANYVKVVAFDLSLKEFTLEGEGLLARAILHENDHLDGMLFIDHVK